MDFEKPKLEKCVFYFSQEGNCQGTTQDIEELQITFESSLGVDNDECGYFVLKTKGWSIDKVNELDELFNRIKKII
jgi:hypothetical protein